MYSKQIGTPSPGFFVILVDQSDSMGEKYVDSADKASFAALAVNRTIYEILGSCRGERMKDRCHITVIGYGDKTELILGGPPSEIEKPPHGTKTLKKKIPDGAGGLVELEQELGIWVQPKHANGTPMAEAFTLAAELVEAWTRENQNNFPPIIINITDGAPNDPAATKTAAERLAGYGTTDGKVLIYNCHIADSGGPEIKLPANVSGLNSENAKLLFELSSVIPQELFSLAEQAGLAPQEGSRGFMMNASPENLTKMLVFGSMKMM